MTIRNRLQRAIRPSTTRSSAALWAKSLLNAVIFFGIFMLALPRLAHWLLPTGLPLSPGLRTGIAGLLAIVGLTAWVACLDALSRQGRGTPFAADAPKHLVTTGLFRRVRNPIMAAELCVIWAAALYLGSLGPALYAVAMSVAAQSLVVHIEEPELRERFGPAYTEYCRDVPRWFPRLGRGT